jgi:DNA-binding winged helix-turn-helix (wHTH) protein
MTYEFGDFAFDLGRRLLLRDEEEVPLTPKEFQTLLLLVEAKGLAVERERLIAGVWPDTAVGDTSLARNISTLRRRVGADAIEVVPKFGYRFAWQVRVRDESRPEPQVPGWQVAEEAPKELSMPAVSKPVAKSFFSWRWVGILAATILLAVSMGRLHWLRTVTADARGDDGPTWTDAQTHLEWMRRDNGIDVTRDEALEYCRTLVIDGRRDWRLPTIEELQTLHDPATSVAGFWAQRAVYWHVKGGIQPTGGETASDLTVLTDLTPPGEEESYDFSFGRRNFDPVDFRADHRALCVR